jgi:hypothetical protein
MIRKLEFDVWSTSWPSDIKDAMGEQLVSALKQKYVWGTGLSEATVTFMGKLAENHPTWTPILQDILNTQ